MESPRIWKEAPLHFFGWQEGQRTPAPRGLPWDSEQSLAEGFPRSQQLQGSTCFQEGTSPGERRHRGRSPKKARVCMGRWREASVSGNG